MVVAALANTCIRHPDRAGFALCMACQQVVCQECATTWDGINYCRECLAKKGEAARATSQLRIWLTGLAMTAISAGLFIGSAHAMVWALAMLVDWQMM
jgi:hypothetical protein